MRKKIELNVDDLRVESFETLSDNDAMMAVGAVKAADSGCYYLCDTGCDTVVCCYPTQGNGTSAHLDIREDR